MTSWHPQARHSATGGAAERQRTARRGGTATPPLNVLWRGGAAPPETVG